ncbi:MAG: CrcB family protein [Acidimicrobiia bacterium]|nr:CrcB family protein [Acidimicrobiia bacterium]
MTTLLAVAAGGLGAAARYGVGVAAQRRFEGRAVGTAVVNVAGAAALGWLLAADPSSGRLLVLGTGFLGGFTTFSTWMVETLALAGGRRTHLGESAANLGLVLAAGWAAFAAASVLG